MRASAEADIGAPDGRAEREPPEHGSDGREREQEEAEWPGRVDEGERDTRGGESDREECEQPRKRSWGVHARTLRSRNLSVVTRSRDACATSPR
jgi:hypothetical protein